MIICVCNRVTERDIHAAVADGVATLSDLRMATGCSSSCGRCAPHANEALKQARREQRAHSLELPVVESTHAFA